MSHLKEALQAERPIQELIESELKNPDPMVRLDIISQIGELPREITPEQKETMDEFGHIRVISKPEVLKEAINPVIGTLADPEPLVQAEAAWALGEIGGEKAREALSAALASENPPLRAAIAQALGRIGGRESVELLKNLLQDHDNDVRLATLDALGAILEKVGRPREIVSDSFGRVTLATPLPEEQREILDSLLDVAQTDEFGHVRLKAAIKIAESQDSEAIMALKEMVKRGEFLSVELDGTSLGDLLLHADAASEEFGRLTKLLGGIVSPEELQEMIDIGVIVKHGEEKLARVHSIVSKIVREMNKRFLEALDLKPTNKKVLSAFTSNVDRICFLKESISAQKKIDWGVEDAVDEGRKMGKSRQKVIEEIEQIISEKDPQKLPGKVATKAQVIGFILRLFQNSGGKKIVVSLEDDPTSGKKLAEWIKKTFWPEESKVGGASAQMADFLNGIGEKNVTVYTQYHSPAQAEAYQKNPQFLRVVDGELSVHEVGASESIRQDDPTKENYPVERSPLIEVTFNGRKIIANSESDREIFTTEYYDQNDKALDFIPLFEFTDEVLTKIGQNFEYFIINGPHYLQRYSQEKYNRIAPRMREQLETLKNAGVKIHYEFSGDTSRKAGEGKWTGIRYFADVLKGNLASMGINHHELEQVIRSVREELDPTVEAVEGNDPYSNFRNAVSLTDYLGLDRLYVHGHSTDITVRRNADEEALETEVKANLHAKQRVVEWLLGEKSTYPTPENRRFSRLLKREGFQELMQFAEALAENSGLQGTDKVRFMRDVAVGGHEQPKEDDFSVVIVPVKWIYGETKVTTSAGDITSSTALLQSGL